MHSLTALILAASVTTPVQAPVITPGDATPPRFETGVLSSPLGPDLAKDALAWALSNRLRYGLPAAATLQVQEVFPTRFGASVHLKQTVKDLDVYEAKLVVTVDAQRRVTQVASNLVRFNKVQDGKPMSRDHALSLAAKDIPLVGLRPDGVPYGGAKAFYFSVDGELHRGFVANVQTLDLRRNWYVAIDAVTGATLCKQDRVHRAALDARAYPISPGGLDAGVGITPTQLVQLTHADGGSMLGETCENLTDAGTLFLEDGGINHVPNTGNHLCGTQLMMYNCCPTKGCDPDAGVVRTQGTVALAALGFPIPGNVNYDVVICDRLRRASNLTNPSGDFVYTPVDPPANQSAIVATDPANSDEFAEVHSFFHVNQVYDWMRGLSGGSFKMRDERLNPPVKPVVWANAMFPNFNELMSNFSCLPPPIGQGGICYANSLMRIDNAAFMPREQFQQIPINGMDTGADTLMIFQGNAADAAYDATVIQHEFGHGAVYATANLSNSAVASDAWGVNNEGGALHEGFADYIAAAFNNHPEVGPYFGPRAAAGSGAPGIATDGYLRSLANQNKCPSVLWGEVHQDGMHVAEALWDGRKGPFAGADQGHTYDAAFYAMLVSITPDADFAMVAAAMSARVAEAFPSIANASQQMTDIFTARGVIGCVKAIDVGSSDLPREYFGITQLNTGSQVPGPVQFRVPGGAGVASVRVTGQSGGGGFGQGPEVHVRTKVGAPIVVTRNGANFSLDATTDVTAAGQGNLTADVPVNAPCGSDVYVAVTSPGGGATLQALNVTFTAQPTCATNDGGTAGDAGTPGDGGVHGDGGVVTDNTIRFIPSVGPDSTLAQPGWKGCGCSSPVDFAWPLLGLLGLARRRRAKQ